MTTTNPLTIILEKGDTELFGRIEIPDEFLYTTVGNNINDVTDNLRDLVADYIAHEGQALAHWQHVDAKDIAFTYEYDLTALFEVFDSIKINSVATLAGLNQSLMRQYVTGKKRPSERQAKKIEEAIRQLGQRLSGVVGV